jgi:hypothetical protein
MRDQTELMGSDSAVTVMEMKTGKINNLIFYSYEKTNKFLYIIHGVTGNDAYIPRMQRLEDNLVVPEASGARRRMGKPILE